MAQTEKQKISSLQKDVLDCTGLEAQLLTEHNVIITQEQISRGKASHKFLWNRRAGLNLYLVFPPSCICFIESDKECAQGYYVNNT